MACSGLNTVYPPTMALFAILPAGPSLYAYYGIHVFILAWSSFVYLRRHGIGRLAAALVPFVAVGQAFYGIFGLAIEHPHFVVGIAWLPLQLLALERALEGNSRAAAALAGVVGLQWLGGYPDVVFSSIVLLAVMAVIAGRGSFLRRCLVPVGCVALGTILVAVQLVPLEEAVGESIRTIEQWRFPRTRSWFRGHYASVAFMPGHLPVLALAGAGLAAGRRIQLAWGIAVLWSLLALVPPFSWLYLLPGFSASRMALGWRNVGPLFVGFLAAAAVARGLQTERRTWVRLVTALSAMSVIVQACLVILQSSSWLMSPIFDQALLQQRAIVLKETIEKADPSARFVSHQEIQGGTPVRYRIASPWGLDPAMPPRRPVQLGQTLGFSRSLGLGMRSWQGIARNPSLAALLGIGWIVAPPIAGKHMIRAGFSAVSAVPGGDTLWYRAPLPRARLVHELRVATHETDELRETVSNAALSRESAVVGLTASHGLHIEAAPEGAVENATITTDEDERVVVLTKTASAALLVLADTYYPGWTATLDGQPVPIVRADYAFRGVGVPAGRHEVEFTYAPLSLRYGAAASAVALGVLLVLALPRPGPKRK
jgi:hypothetical protein